MKNIVKGVAIVTAVSFLLVGMASVASAQETEPETDLTKAIVEPTDEIVWVSEEAIEASPVIDYYYSIPPLPPGPGPTPT